MDVDCRESMDLLTEYARRGEHPPEHLQAHMQECQRCRQHWAGQESLAVPLSKLRQAMAGERSPSSRRKELLEEFERAHRPAWPRWAWAVAAVVLMAVLVLQSGGFPWRMGAPPQATVADEFTGTSLPDLPADGEFVAVAFSEPPAPGESVRVVREELDGVELAVMGIDTPGPLGSSFDTEVVLGEDGMPRAVRVLNYDEL